MINKVMPYFIVLTFCSCTGHQESVKAYTNLQLLEAGLTELQEVGLLETSVPFNECVFKNEDFFPDGQKTPESIAGLSVVPLEFIFTNIDGISLSSIRQKNDIYEVTFWDFGSQTSLVVKLGSNLEALEATRAENM